MNSSLDAKILGTCPGPLPIPATTSSAMLRWISACTLALLVSMGCSPTLFVSHVRPEEALQELERQLSPPNSQPLRARIEAVLSQSLHGRQLSSEVNAAWQIMHGVIPFGQQLKIDTPDRGACGALDYAFGGGQLMGFELMAGDEILPATGRRGLKARLEPGSYVGQGHVDQWLAIFAMADVPLDTPVQHGGAQFTLLDWARQAQFDVTRNLLDEYSWTLIALTHYFPEEPQWPAADGRTVGWEDLVNVELDKDRDLSPCGGAHRLAGITRALAAKRRLGLADSPVWQRAQTVVDQSLANVHEYRAATGALSSFYFVRAGTTADLTAELASSGHLLEFAALAVPETELAAPWLELAVMRLCSVLEQTRNVELDCGALYHALNGLKIYNQRRF